MQQEGSQPSTQNPPPIRALFARQENRQRRDEEVAPFVIRKRIAAKRRKGGNPLDLFDKLDFSLFHRQ